MSENSSDYQPMPPWRLLLCILGGATLFALFFVTPALYQAPQIAMEDWRTVLIEIAFLQVTLMSGGLFLIVCPFCKRLSLRWVCLLGALLIGVGATFYPTILQLIEGEEVVEGKLEGISLSDGGEFLYIDPQSKQAKRLKKRGHARVELDSSDPTESVVLVSSSDAERILRQAESGDALELRTLRVLKRLLSVKKVE